MNHNIHYQVIGKEIIDIVVEMGLGACMSEWFPAAHFIDHGHGILLYERRGVNHSTPSEKNRTPRQIASELYALLEDIPHEKKIILIAHSQGGLYAQQFARLYPNMVRGLILLDPLSANDNQFKQQLTKKEYYKSGVDKSKNFQLMHKLSKMHLGFMLKAILKNAPPFYYYKEYDRESQNDILSAATNPSHANTAWLEYKEAHKKENIVLLREKSNFPLIPLVLITHSSELAIQENMKFGNNKREFAEKVEKIWQKIMKEYLDFSKNSKWIQSKLSTHYIHLTEPELLAKAIDWVKQNEHEQEE